MDKLERYQWVKPGDRGERRSVPLDSIKIDHSYQRQPVSDKVILAIAAAFSWAAFGVVTLARRANGDLYCLDGQQRLEAARRRGDIREVPAIIFESQGIESEALAFLLLNCGRKAVSALEKFRAAVLAGKDPECAIDSFVRSSGLKIAVNGTTSGGIEFVAALSSTWKINTEACKRAILAQHKIVADGPLNNYVHKGLFWLAHNGVVIEDHLEKIIKAGGLTRILHSINAFGINAGMEAKSVRACGNGILDIINHKRRNRIVVEA